MKKYVKIALLVIVALIFLGTFVFLYQKSQPKETVYNTEKAEIADLKRTTVATGKIEPRDEILIKPQISGIIDEVYKEAGQTVKPGASGRNQCQTGRNRFCPHAEAIYRQTDKQRRI